ncbi:DUF1553 domain-containing protein [Bryobacter aggregatus]|uniref:DUF1553 domain-containing protein n=1 Tax=Bryobacter aggregatus TaxID=360054 RepID=UPI000689D2B5|nr:DUF1553 domain-containing protein [Bryobacter aggregatus]
MFDEIRRFVKKIPKGKVATYGQVAVAAGFPRASRQVAWSLKTFDPTLPWQRVVGKGGKILLRGAGGVEQVQRLEAEGVVVHGTRIDLKRFGCILLLAMVLQGADLKEEALVAKRRSYWAFQKPVRSEIPAGVHPIDFLEAAKRPKLERRALLRRLSLDLTGLPPQIDGPYEQILDRLMATPRYGERWASKWLDVVRYADTNGYELDVEREQSWRYRDYVIRAFNADKPYRDFLREQLAGDELYPGEADPLIATGFLRAGPRHVVGGNQDEEQNRQEDLIEMTHGISSAFLGMTVGCARCHNHKFDPILQTDYYRLQAVLASTQFRQVQLADGDTMLAVDRLLARHQARLKPILDELAAIEKPYREQFKRDKKKTLEPQFQAVLNLDPGQLNDEQKRLRKDAEKQLTPTWDEVVALIPPALKAKRASLRKRMHELAYDEPAAAPQAYAAFTVDAALPTHVLKVGDPKFKLQTVEAGLPLVLAKDLGNLSPDPHGRRAALANWLASPDHPLTARVMVNRIWQFRMGKGIVATPNDFGALGARPTNLKLLDWLATEFIASGWSVKHIDRLILTSAVYQQQAEQRRRMDSDMLRDSILATSGKLNLKMYGKPVKTPIEPEVYDLIFTEGEPDNLWPLPKDKTEMDRRSIYVLNKRTVRLPMMTNFDQPDAMSSCPERSTSTHALQSLSMMNSDFIQEQAKAFAVRIKGDPVGQAYRIALFREATAAERQQAQNFFQKGGTVEDFALAMLNRNDFLYLP